jgi:hypothetical protein
MRRYGLYDTTRGFTTAVAAGVAGLLLWVASQVGTQSVGRFWAAMAIVAGAGLVTSLAHVVVGWTKGLRVRVSAGTIALAFLPTLVCVGWILLATQPGNGFAEGHVDSWSRSLGLLNVIHALALWHGVLAFGFGVVLGRSFDTVPEIVVDTVPADEPVATAVAPPVADEPVAAERHEVAAGARRHAAAE